MYNELIINIKFFNKLKINNRHKPIPYWATVIQTLATKMSSDLLFAIPNSIHVYLLFPAHIFVCLCECIMYMNHSIDTLCIVYDIDYFSLPRFFVSESNFPLSLWRPSQHKTHFQRIQYSTSLCRMLQGRSGHFPTARTQTRNVRWNCIHVLLLTGTRATHNTFYPFESSSTRLHSYIIHI